jgi:hypothetical protein
MLSGAKHLDFKEFEALHFVQGDSRRDFSEVSILNSDIIKYGVRRTSHNTQNERTSSKFSNGANGSARSYQTKA